MQQDCAVHSRLLAGFALSPLLPQETGITGYTEQTAGRLRAAPGGGGIHAFAFLPIRYAFLYRTCLPTSFHKNSLKSPFTYIGTKKAKNSHLKIKFFQKNLRAAETALKREKSGYIIVSNLLQIPRTADILISFSVSLRSKSPPSSTVMCTSYSTSSDNVSGVSPSSV